MDKNQNSTFVIPPLYGERNNKSNDNRDGKNFKDAIYQGNHLIALTTDNTIIIWKDNNLITWKNMPQGVAKLVPIPNDLVNCFILYHAKHPIDLLSFDQKNNVICHTTNKSYSAFAPLEKYHALFADNNFLSIYNLAQYLQESRFDFPNIITDVKVINNNEFIVCSHDKIVRYQFNPNSSGDTTNGSNIQDKVGKSSLMQLNILVSDETVTDVVTDDKYIAYASNGKITAKQLTDDANQFNVIVHVDREYKFNLVGHHLVLYHGNTLKLWGLDTRSGVQIKDLDQDQFSLSRYYYSGLVSVINMGDSVGVVTEKKIIKYPNVYELFMSESEPETPQVKTKDTLSKMIKDAITPAVKDQILEKFRNVIADTIREELAEERFISPELKAQISEKTRDIMKDVITVNVEGFTKLGDIS